MSESEALKVFWLVKPSSTLKGARMFCRKVGARHVRDSYRIVIDGYIPRAYPVSLEDAPSYVRDAMAVLDVLPPYQYVPGIGENRGAGYLIDVKD